MEQAYLERSMIGNSDMVLSIPLRGELDMGTGLTPRLVSQVPERACQFGTRAVAGNLHAASTSSRT